MMDEFFMRNRLYCSKRGKLNKDLAALFFVERITKASVCVCLLCINLNIYKYQKPRCA